MARQLIKKPQQTHEYYTMWGIESGCHQAAHISAKLKKEDIILTEKQISGALQRLKKQNIVKYTNRWDRVTPRDENLDKNHTL